MVVRVVHIIPQRTIKSGCDFLLCLAAEVQALATFKLSGPKWAHGERRSAVSQEILLQPQLYAADLPEPQFPRL